MASVQKKNNNLYVVYRRNLPEGGQSKPIYEKQPTNSERAAQKRADYITALLKQNKYADPSNPNDYQNFCAMEDLTLGHFLDLWVPIYAPLEWSHSMYESSMSEIKIHIKPDRIAKLQIRALTSADIAAFLGRLSKKEISGAKADSLRKRGEPVPHLSPKTIKMIRDLLNVALNSAKMWGVIEKNPVCEIPRCSQLKKREARRQVKYERKIWAPEYMFAALKDMEETDPLLHLAVHLSFMSLSRGGETTAVTLDSIDFEQRTIQLDKTIQRVYFDAIDAVSDDELIFVFPNKIPGSKSAMVLKRQKTPKSDRVFYMTKQLEANIRQRISYMEKAKEYFGDTHTAQRLFPACTSPACARVYLAGRAGVLPDGYGEWPIHFLTFWPGTLIPVRDRKGRIQALQIRKDYAKRNKRKYYWLASGDLPNGLGTGAPAHFAGDPHAKEILITEGALKADAAHALTGKTFIALGGTPQFKGVLPYLPYIREYGRAAAGTQPIKGLTTWPCTRTAGYDTA